MPFKSSSNKQVNNQIKMPHKANKRTSTNNNLNNNNSNNNNNFTSADYNAWVQYFEKISKDYAANKDSSDVSVLTSLSGKNNHETMLINSIKMNQLSSTQRTRVAHRKDELKNISKKLQVKINNLNKPSKPAKQSTFSTPKVAKPKKVKTKTNTGNNSNSRNIFMDNPNYSLHFGVPTVYKEQKRGLLKKRYIPLNYFVRFTYKNFNNQKCVIKVKMGLSLDTLKVVGSYSINPKESRKKTEEIETSKNIPVFDAVKPKIITMIEVTYYDSIFGSKQESKTLTI